MWLEQTPRYTSLSGKAVPALSAVSSPFARLLNLPSNSTTRFTPCPGPFVCLQAQPCMSPYLKFTLWTLDSKCLILVYFCFTLSHTQISILIPCSWSTQRDCVWRLVISNCWGCNGVETDLGRLLALLVLRANCAGHAIEEKHDVSCHICHIQWHCWSKNQRSGKFMKNSAKLPDWLLGGRDQVQWRRWTDPRCKVPATATQEMTRHDNSH